MLGLRFVAAIPRSLCWLSSLWGDIWHFFGTDGKCHCCLQELGFHQFHESSDGGQKQNSFLKAEFSVCTQMEGADLCALLQPEPSPFRALTCIRYGSASELSRVAHGSFWRHSPVRCRGKGGIVCPPGLKMPSPAHISMP